MHGPEIRDVFKTVDTICDANRCRPIDDGKIIFQDSDHLSLEWTLSQQARLEKLPASIA